MNKSPEAFTLEFDSERSKGIHQHYLNMIAAMPNNVYWLDSSYAKS